MISKEAIKLAQIALVVEAVRDLTSQCEGRQRFFSVDTIRKTINTTLVSRNDQRTHLQVHDALLDAVAAGRLKTRLDFVQKFGL